MIHRLERSDISLNVVPLDLTITGVVALGAFGLWSGSDGGYEEVLWYPVAVIFVLLALVLAWASPGRSLDRSSRVALGALGAFTAWTYLSIAWAADAGIALTAANRTLAYLLVFGVLLLRPWTHLGTAVLAAVWGAVTICIGFADLAAVAYRGDVAGAFMDNRLVVPIDYANANAALFVLAALPLAFLAQAGAVPRLLRGVATGGATLGFGLAFLAQSKGSAIGLAAATLAVVVLAPRRARTLLAILLPVGIVLLFYRPLLGIHANAGDANEAARTTRDAVFALVYAFAAGTAAGLALAWLDGRFVLPAPSRARTLARLFCGVTLVAALGGVLACFAVFGSPRSLAERGWRSFTHPSELSSSSSHFATTAGNNRYDFWRVSALELRRSPLLGAGADNFGADYVRHRRSSEEPLYPHSIEASLLGQTGLVGLALFAVFVAAAAACCVRAARAAVPLAAAGSAALAMLGYWLAHGSVDWLWEFPGLSGPVFAVTAAVAAAGSASAMPAAPAARGALRRLRAPLVAVLALAALTALGPAWLSARKIDTALAGWRLDPAAAYADLESAASLDPLSDEAYVTAGTIAERRRDWSAAARYFSLALDRVDGNWYSHLELAIARAKLRRPGVEAELREARRLDPREPVIADVAADVRSGRPIATGALDRVFVTRAKVRSAAG